MSTCNTQKICGKMIAQSYWFMALLDKPPIKTISSGDIFTFALTLKSKVHIQCLKLMLIPSALFMIEHVSCINSLQESIERRNQLESTVSCFHNKFMARIMSAHTILTLIINLSTLRVQKMENMSLGTLMACLEAGANTKRFILSVIRRVVKLFATCSIC